MDKIKKTSINLPIDMSKKLKLLAIAKDTNQSELMKEYIKKGIENDIELAKNLLD
jgi:predicted DNA-binding protein